MNTPFYITTTLPYVNSKPHAGTIMEMIRADSVARYKRLVGYEVFFNTGTDEHGQKLFDQAQGEGISVQEFVDRGSQYFRNADEKVQISYDNFIRTTDKDHMAAAQEFWKLVASKKDKDGNPLIYKKNYQTKYCVGCELEKQDSDLVDGKCPDHPKGEIQLVDEENYFFRFSSFQEELIKLYDGTHEHYQMTVLPDFRLKEVRSFVSSGLQDFSISRLASKMSWGVPVPGDHDHVMYVWFDALVNYVSCLGWPQDTEKFNKFWVNGTPVQYFGQDNLRQQTAMWQAMLLAAELSPTRTLICNGFIMGEGGVKMSKSIGNVVDPLELVEKYGTDALRLFLLRHIHPFDGSPLSYEVFHARYTSDLVNGLGNLTSRLMNLCEKHVDSAMVEPSETKFPEDYTNAFNSFRIDEACEVIFRLISELDGDISKAEPFKLVKTNLPAAQKLLIQYRAGLFDIAQMLLPIIPTTAQKIIELVKENKKPTEPLFPRIEL